MRVLRFVGPGEDEAHLVLETPDGDEQFSLHVTDQLRAATSDLPRLQPVKLPAMTVSPRDIQVRVRSGEAPEAIAEQAGMSLDRILRFALPVIEERNRITVEARRSRARRSTPDGQLIPFGESVDVRFEAHSVDPAMVDWDSHRRADGQWVVEASWHSGQTERVAKWAFSLTTRTLTPLDETAADLLSDRPIRPVVSVVPDLPEADEEPEEVETAVTDQLPDELFDQDADEASARPALVHTEDALFGPLALDTEPAPAPAATKHARPQVPAWDDILLGVRRNHD